MGWRSVCGMTGYLLWAVPAASGAAEAALQPDVFSAMIRMVSVLVCIVAVMLAIAAALKKLNVFRRPLLGDKRCIQIVETVYLGPKRSLALVRAGSEYILLGLTPQQISFLTKIDVARPPGPCGAGADSRDFETVLAQAVSAAPPERNPLNDDTAGNALFEKKGVFRKALDKLTATRLGDHGWSK